MKTGIANAMAASPVAPILLPTTRASAMSAIESTTAEDSAGRYCFANICMVNCDTFCFVIAVYLYTYQPFHMDALFFLKALALLFPDLPPSCNRLHLWGVAAKTLF